MICGHLLQPGNIHPKNQEKIPWKKKSVVPDKKEEQGKNAGNLMIRITAALNAEEG